MNAKWFLKCLFSISHLFLLNSLVNNVQPWECGDFLRTWDAETPGVNAPDERLLQGIAIKIETKLHKSCSIDGSASSSSYKYVPFEDLSSNLQV